MQNTGARHVAVEQPIKATHQTLMANYRTGTKLMTLPQACQLAKKRRYTNPNPYQQ